MRQPMEKEFSTKSPYWSLPFCYWACVDEAPHGLGKPRTGHTALGVSASARGLASDPCSNLASKEGAFRSTYSPGQEGLPSLA